MAGNSSIILHASFYFLPLSISLFLHFILKLGTGIFATAAGDHFTLMEGITFTAARKGSSS